jgi:hypothetical protein
MDRIRQNWSSENIHPSRISFFLGWQQTDDETLRNPDIKIISGDKPLH